MNAARCCKWLMRISMLYLSASIAMVWMRIGRQQHLFLVLGTYFGLKQVSPRAASVNLASD